MESGDQCCVECKGTERGRILSALGEGTAGQVEVVGGAEKEDSFRFGEVERSVGPRSGGAGVCISSMWGNDCSRAWLRYVANAFDCAVNLIQPAVKLLRQSGSMVRVPRSGMTGCSGHH